MTPSNRAVDAAMDQQRPEKQTIRSLWVEEVKTVAARFPDSEEPWYLTLSGAEGYDIQLIIDNGLISLTEIDSISESDQNKIVAIERSNRAIAELQSKFVGLKIKEVDFRDLIRGEGQFSWPQGTDRQLCRAHVVNLDLNAPLVARQDQGRIVFPVLEWVRKLCQIHASSPHTDWTLCLTLHGEVVWPQDVDRYTREFLFENFRREPVFAQSCRAFLGDALVQLLMQNTAVSFMEWDRDDQQKFIMVMVPKLVARLVHIEGWQVKTERNLRYGGGSCAPMVAWIVRFTWDSSASATPDAVYRDALRNILSGAGLVNANGEIEDSCPSQ